jgi:release factor glutamine methyltransferase
LKTLGQYINELKSELPSFYDSDEALSVAEFYVCELLEISRTALLIGKTEVLSEGNLKLLNSNRDRLIAGEPVQYITGKAYFYGLEFFVDKRVLIPRQETEILIREIIDNNRSRTGLNILDIGTGSGCIAISLKKSMPESDVHVIDVSAGALDVCSINAAKNNVKLCYYRHDILSAHDFNSGIKFDIIVSNPPYVTESEKELMFENVLDHEPELALFVSDNDPLIFYRKIAQYAKDHLVDGGKLYFEINENFGPEVKEMCISAGFKEALVVKDLNNKDRFVISY